MIERSGRVVERDGAFVWVETDRPTACGNCATGGCGTTLVGQLAGKVGTSRVRALNTLQLRVGEPVVIGVQDGALVRSAIVVYLLPLLSMFACAAAGFWLGAGQDAAAREGLALLGAAAGFAGGLWGVRRLTRRVAADSRFQPVLLRRGSAEG